MESNTNSAFVKNDKIENKPFNKNSLSSFLGTTKRTDSTTSGINPLSLFSNPAKLPSLVKNDLGSSSNALGLIKTPSMLKQESQSEMGNHETPVPLPADTPAMPHKSSAPSSGLLQIFNNTPVAAKQEKEETQNLQQNFNQFNIGGGGGQITNEKFNQNTGMDLANLTTYSNQRKTQEEPTLQNIVSTVDLKCKLDLKTIALNARNTEYNPKRFAAAIMKIRTPKTTALIFSSGKMVCTGAKSEDLSKKASKKYAKTIKNMGFEVRFTDFKVQNIVASADVGFAIRLESLSHKHADFCQYEPEIFPGLIYRIYSPKVVVLIFVSGKIVLTGAKTREQINEAYKSILPILQMHKKKNQIE